MYEKVAFNEMDILKMLIKSQIYSAEETLDITYIGPNAMESSQ